jgi:HK97 family phage portal protein
VSELAYDPEMERTTESGLIVTDRRHSRAASEHPQIEPRDHVPNVNPPTGSVGPQSRAGDVMTLSPPGDGHFHADAWDGWPSGWQTPYMTAGHSADTMFARTATAMTCVDLNSRQLASFPIYGLKGPRPVRLPAWRESPEPELYGSWSDFMHGVGNALMIRGEAFQFVTGRFADDTIARFVNLNPDAVGVEFIDGRLEYLIDRVPVDRRDICHLRYQSYPGRLRGIGPLEWTARSLATSLALEAYATNLATRGGVPWGVLKALRNLDSGQATDAQNRWVEAAARRDGAPAVLGTGFDLQVLSFSPEDMALLGLREFDERRIAAAFGIPGYLVNVSMAQGLTYTNASQLFQHHWSTTLRPIAKMMSEAWSNWLLPRGTAIEFNPGEYVQPPMTERALAYNYMFNLQDPVTGRRAIEIEEIRAAERLPLGPWAEVGDEQLETTQRVLGGRTA